MNWSKIQSKLIIILVLLLILVVIGVIFIRNNNASTSYQTTSEPDQPVQTIRHDNSGSGSDTESNSPIQEHLQRALQHIGL